jgi:putative ABC transport system permease protein
VAIAATSANAPTAVTKVTGSSVAQCCRTREYGICLALGASSATLIRRLLAQSVIVIGGGLTAGLLASLVLTRLITRLLYGVTPLDPLTFVTVPLLLFGVACLATYLPARRATKVSPAVALRFE